MPARIKLEEPDTVDIDAADDEDDEVAREIEVFLSPGLTKQLHLLQYPLQQSEIIPPTVARIKPRHGMIEIDHPIPDYIERDGSYVLSDRVFQSQTIPVQTHMCLGRLENKQDGTSALHLVPISRISQMRPSFRHINDAMNASKPSTAEEEEEEARAAAAKSNEKKPLVFQRKESERAALARRSSYAYKIASENSEEWQELTVQNIVSIESQMLLQRVDCPDPDTSIVLGNTSTVDYVKSLNYISTAASVAATGKGRSSTDFVGNDISSVVARLTSQLHGGWPMPFSVLRQQFTPEVTDTTIQHALSACAVLVRGNFCAHSKFLNLSEPLKVARTFILLVLQQDGFIERGRLTKTYEANSLVPPEHLLLLLKQVAKRVERGWTLRIEDDVSFLDAHPDLCSLHDHYWTKQAVRFHDKLLTYRS